MVSYLDTSFLYKLYVNEKASAEAVAWFRRYQELVAISALSDVKIVSSLYRNFPRPQAAETHEAYSGDRTLGVYTEPAMSKSVYVAAQTLAEEYAGPHKLRSLDILPVATALHYKVDAIATFDRRLADISEALGLEVVPTRS